MAELKASGRGASRTNADALAGGVIYNFTAGDGSAIPGAHTHHPSAPKPFDVDGWRQRVRDFLQHVEREKESHA
jgi:hypothetical protein